MKRALLLVIAAAGTVALFAAGLGLGAGGGGAVKLTAKLDARHETPAPKSAARAAGLYTATLTGRSLAWRLTFSHLTGKAVAAHIHLGKPGVAGPVAVPLCGPCSSGAHGTLTVTPKVRAALLAGTTYVNVHTAKNAAGEIRGQLGRLNVPAAQGSTSGPTTTSDDGGYGDYG
jgi:CHRD domain-containing protein